MNDNVEVFSFVDR